MTRTGGGGAAGNALDRFGTVHFCQARRFSNQIKRQWRSAKMGCIVFCQLALNFMPVKTAQTNMLAGNGGDSPDKGKPI